MKQKLSGSQLILLTVLPAVMLALSALYHTATAKFALSPYLMLCLAGILALCGSLLWGCGLCSRALRAAALRTVILITALLTLSCAVFFASGLPAVQRASDILYACVMALLMPLPALLYRFVTASLEMEPKKDPLLYVLLGLSAAAVVAALSNPLHGLLFTGGRFGAVTWAMLAWLSLGLLFSHAFLLLRSRKFTARMIPLCALSAAGIALIVGCILSQSAFAPVLPYAVALYVYATLTLMLATKVLPDGRIWPALLQHTTFPVQLMDREGMIVYGADLALPITPAHKSAILSNRCPMILEKDMELSVAAIPGGYAVQQKDLRDLHALQETLDGVKKELEETYLLLSRESEIEAKLQRMQKKNAFFAEQEAKIQEKTDRASLLLRCAAAAAPEPGFRRAVVTRANVLVTYIQNLGLLLREAKETDLLPVTDLASALELSAKAAAAAGMRCRVYNVAQGTFPASMVIALYDLSELVLEEAIAKELVAVEIRVRNEQGGLRLSVSLQDADAAILASREEEIAALAALAGGTTEVTEENGCVTVGLEFSAGGV